MCFSTPSYSAPQVKEYATTKDVTAATTAARQNQKDKAAASLGTNATINTSPFGVSGSANTNQKTLLGQ